MTSDKQNFRDGIRHSLPFLLSVWPFGLVVGTLGVNAGAGFWDVVLQSALFFAGASQTVMWELFPGGNPIWVIALAIFAVNFRLVLYSAAIGRQLEPLSKPRLLSALFLLQDVSLAMGLKRVETDRGLSWHYYMGLSLVLYVIWLTATATGAAFGVLITEPRLFGLDVLVPIYFLCLVMGFRSKPNAAIIFAVSASVAATTYLLVGSPYHIGAGGLCGMGVAALLAKSAERSGTEPI
ncbi:MAG: AzlC family ABC transporter permease [Ahrensia sp.]|nr:AzlC family ABC transporter permease [Ahrensia sp.]